MVNHHIHFYSSNVDAMKKWYADTFNAIPGKRGKFEAADLPGVNLTFAPSEAALPGTKGRVLDHIGFEVKDLEAFCKKIEAGGVKFDLPYRKIPPLGISIAFITDPVGNLYRADRGPRQAVSAFRTRTSTHEVLSRHDQLCAHRAVGGADARRQRTSGGMDFPRWVSNKNLSPHPQKDLVHEDCSHPSDMGIKSRIETRSNLERESQIGINKHSDEYQNENPIVGCSGPVAVCDELAQPETSRPCR